MSKGMKMDVYLEVLHCPTHDVWALSVADENDGIRVTNSKCCGSWQPVKAFLLTHSVAIQLVAAMKSKGALSAAVAEAKGELK